MEKCLCFRLLNRCPHQGKSGDENCALRAIAVELHDLDWSVRRSKEGQPLCNSVSKPDRAAETDRVLSLRGRARAGWLKLPEPERETQFLCLKDVFFNPHEFLPRLRTVQRPCAIVPPDAQTRSWYVQIVGDNYPHNEPIPLLLNGVRAPDGHHDLVDTLWLRDHLASQGIRRYAFRSRCARDSSKAQWRSVFCLPQQVLQAQPSGSG